MSRAWSEDNDDRDRVIRQLAEIVERLEKRASELERKERQGPDPRLWSPDGGSSGR
ncbi:MAG TPA: hypothetical protein VFZ61_33690 [Polyangiales bacterium]